ncbi:MAG TPA: hypothetical protein PKZ26_02935 [Anaerolineaceae bacterium]|jgi:protein-tyrosine-phosphatase|nr:hypothetical protein [Anaerolineaceae bacterium]NMC18267.1 hypothetical protein [Chloroflexota bacterium]HNW14428.1 hypothetical protein [Anaerolineaceae bacterium]HOE01726.1 hypothetical protein [Anaerolineaceae bacterium]HQM54725.1 hypothetical protein [Anaerolineaceae bacterium]
MPNVLFVCSANRFRSVLAAEYFTSLLEKQAPSGEWVVGSAGIWAREGVAPTKEALQWAAGKQLHIESVRSREISNALIAEADLIIVMTNGQREAISIEFPEAREKLTLLSEIAAAQIYDIPDPIIESGEEPLQIAEEISTLIDAGFERILKRAAGRANNLGAQLRGA